MSAHAAPADAPAALTEPALWEAAWRIAWIGASNPVAVALTLAELSRAWRQTQTPDGMGSVRHPALAAIAGHLAYLHGQGLGPDDATLRQVQRHAHAMGLDPQHHWSDRIAAPVKIAGAVTGWSEYQVCDCGKSRPLP